MNCTFVSFFANMESRGRMMLGLSKPKPRKENPEGTRKPLGDLTNKNLFKKSFDHCRRFLNTVKTGEELRNMENSDMDLPMYDPNMSADISIAEEAVPDSENVTDPEHNGAENVAPVGHVRFGALGFGNFADAEMENDVNRNRVENETQERSDAREQVEGEGFADDIPAGPSHASDDSTTKKRKRVKGTKKQNKKNKSQADNRRDIVEKLKSKDLPVKDDATIKKNFKSDFITIKFKISQTHLRAQTVPDFALFVLDNVHSPDAVPPSQHAGKYMTYINGSMADKFFAEGITYDPNKFFICKDEVGWKEDRDLPFVKTREIARKATKKKSIPEPRIEVEDSDSEPDSESPLRDTSSSEEVSGDDSPDDDVDIFNMQQHAKSVSWGTPARNNSDDSDSSAGVRVFGRAAEKSVSAEKKKKRAAKKKHAKTSLRRTRTDILDSPEFSINRPDPSGSRGNDRGKGRSGRGRGKGGRGKSGRGKGGRGK